MACLRRIRRVKVDVAGGQVGGDDMGAAPTHVQVDVYAELGLLHDPRSPFFVARPGAHAVATDGHIPTLIASRS